MKKLMNSKKIFLIIISTLLLLSMAAIMIDTPPAHAAYTGPTIDTQTGAEQGGTAAANSIVLPSLTTHSGNELIYVQVVSYTTESVSSVTSSPSLTWANRATVTYDTTRQLSTYYAVLTTAGSITITIDFSGSTYQKAAVAFGIAGANPTTPFDGSTTGRTNTGSASPASATISTSAGNELIIGSLSVESNPTLTVGSGFTLVKTQLGSTYREVSAEYQQSANQQTALSVPYTGTSTDAWGMIADAVQPATDTATHFGVSGFTSPTTAGASHTVTVTAEDASGATVTSYSGIVAITSSDAQAVLPANAGLPMV